MIRCSRIIFRILSLDKLHFVHNIRNLQYCDVGVPDGLPNGRNSVDLAVRGDLIELLLLSAVGILARDCQLVEGDGDCTRGEQPREPA